jgi:hypothetical protein
MLQLYPNLPDGRSFPRPYIVTFRSLTRSQAAAVFRKMSEILLVMEEETQKREVKGEEKEMRIKKQGR